MSIAGVCEEIDIQLNRVSSRYDFAVKLTINITN